MSRESFKDDAYFKEKVSKLSKFIEEDVEAIQHGEITQGQVQDVSMGCCDFSLDVLYSMYSGGYKKSKIKDYYSKTINLIGIFQDEWKRDLGSSIRFYRMQQLLCLLSFGILLDATTNEVRELITVIDNVEQKYQILDYYISYFDETREINPKLGIGEMAFKELTNIFNLSNEEIESQNLVGNYLDTWFEDSDRVLMHDTHNSDLNNFYGYWSFESAAFVKIRGLDDSIFRNNPYYPKDLV